MRGRSVQELEGLSAETLANDDLLLDPVDQHDAHACESQALCLLLRSLSDDNFSL